MRPSRWVLTIAIILVIPPVALVVFWFVLLGSSGSNEEAVSMVRGLSQQRLAQLFVDVRAMSRSQGLMPHFFIFKDGKIVPKITEDETAYLVIKRHHQTVVKARFIRIGVEVARIEKKTSSNAVATNIDFSTWTSAQIDSVSN